MVRWRRRALVVAVTAAAALASVGSTAVATSAGAGKAAWPGRTVNVRLIGLNDLHGNLEPPSGSSGEVALADGSTVPAGGAAYLATHVKQLRQGHPNSLVLSGGDNIGASPLPSALFHDEPTIEFLNALGTKASVVGNHELDEGYAELRRMQTGGCHPEDGCQFRDSFGGADFPYLAANMTYHGFLAAAPFTVKLVHGVSIGIIGTPLREMRQLVSADALKGLEFSDEVAAINRSARLLDRFGVHAQVAVIHKGDEPDGGGPNDCNVDGGPATDIATKASPAVDAVFSAHSHQQYNCTVTDPAGNPRPLIQGASFGRLLSVVDLRIDRFSRDVLRGKTVAHNEIVSHDVPKDPKVRDLVQRAVTESAPIANRKVGEITADLPRTQNAAGESPLGDVIADAQLASDEQGQLSLMNPGGIRADLNYASSPNGEGDGVVTYGEAYATQPFADVLQTITLTGKQLDAALEQQWQPDGTQILQVSSTLHYTWSASAPTGSKVSDITVDGKPVTPDQKLRVVTNNFLVGGGDGFTELSKGTDLSTGPIDIDALTKYLGNNQPLAPPPADRIQRVS